MTDFLNLHLLSIQQQSVDWLHQIIIPFTLVSALLLISRHYFLKAYGPQLSYLSWALIPLSLIVPFIELPNWFAAINEGQSIQRFVATSTQAPELIGLDVILAYGWAVGFLSLLSYWLFRHFTVLYAQRLWQVAELTGELDSLKNANLKVYKSADVFSPMLVGLIQPKLVIPEDFDAIFSKEQQALILEHELCHFKRNDMVWNTFALLILAAMWFHPLAWLAFSRFRRDQELSCDQTVLARKHTTCRINYSKALLVAAETMPPLGFAQLSFKEYGDKNVMFERINLIKNGHRGSKLIGIGMLVSAVTLMSAMSYAGDVGEKAKRTPPKAKESIMPIHRVEPNYPEKAIVEKLEGAVVLKYDVDTDGSVINVEVMTGEPAYVFDRVAVTALKQWKYEKVDSISKNNLVQLDFRLDKNSTYKGKDLIEKIKVSN